MVCSFVGFIADDEDVQKRQPQILVVNKKCLTEASFVRLLRHCRDKPNFILKRCDSAWVSVDMMVDIMRLVGERLRELKPLTQVHLLMDCAPIVRSRG